MVAVFPPDHSDPRPSSPSLRAVAKAAGVSAMTVSRVLRNHPKVSPLVREKVSQAARDLGYRPDPNVAKLMQHLRLRRKPAYQTSLCALTSRPVEAPFDSYSKEIIGGAQRQAEARGYGFNTLCIAEGKGLQRVLRSRGVEALLLLPMAEPTALADLLDWSQFSIVAPTSSVLAPEVHCVVPHHFKNTQLLCRQLNVRGYRRIGLVLHAGHVERVYHTYNAAVTWHGMFHDSSFVPPLIYSRAEPTGLAEWFARERPDVIVTHTERLCRRFAQILGLQIPGEIGFASTNTVPDSTCTGIDELAREIGAMAVDLVTSMVQRGEKGVPSVPASTLLLGRWVEGTTCPGRAIGGRGPRERSTQSRLVYVEH